MTDESIARVKMYTETLIHLDFVASLDEEDHGGSATAERIRKVLIPFIEAEREQAILAQRT